ncbi:hypothetical protein [Thomasclavelia cocleata]|uniref:hypothetical protein n=1 Tax=Thomasclavelia cocleata TaxID=69824 RepID=UPI00242ADE5B|nr:hypothetical protein [Thomasclavelia cocleata]
MKKFSKLLLVLLLCFTFIGCSNKKGTTDISKLLKDAGYTVKYNKDDYTTITISESKNGKDKSQFIAYVEKDEISSIAFIQLPEDSQNYDDMIIGYIYTNEKSDAQVDDKAKKAADKVFKKLNISIEELTDYCLDIHKDEGKSLKK